MTNNEILNELNLFELNPIDFEEYKASAIKSGGEYWDVEKMLANKIGSIKVYSGEKEVQEAIEVVTGPNGYVIFAPKPIKVKGNEIVTIAAKGGITAEIKLMSIMTKEGSYE